MDDVVVVNENDEVIVRIQGVGVPDICSTMRGMLQMAGIKAVTADGAVGAAAGYLLNKLVDYLLDGGNADALAALTLELLRRHTLDDLRAMRDAATGGEKDLLRDVLIIAQYTCKEGH
jgi:hypothetical protein